MKKNFQFSIFPPEADQSVRRAGNFQKGFTLIELMTSVSIFAVVMIVSLGSITGIFDANRQTRSLRAVVNNLNLAMETMSKEMRYGTRYHCGEGTFEIAQNCPGGGTILSFLSSDNEQITYRLADTRLEKKVAAGNFEAVTAPELVLEDLKFYAVGSGTENDLQSKVIIKLRGYAGGEKNRSNLTIQTLVSQRLVDTDPTIPYTTPYPAPPYETPSTFWDLTVTNNTASLGTVSGPGINCGVDCEESYTNSANVPLTASPIGTNLFSGWSGDCSGTGGCNLTMTANKAVTATFIPPSYTIDYLVVGGGGGGGNGVTPGGAPTGQPGGGGGGGDVVSSSFSVIDGGSALTVTVGPGGLIRGGSGGQGFPGGTSSIVGPGISVSATGGGGGGASNGADEFEKAGGAGANGGGGGGSGGNPSAGGGGTFIGGTGNNSSGGGGGGDSQNGGNGNPTGTGGNGTTNFITGSGGVYGPGGGGGHSGSDTGAAGGSGGLGGQGSGILSGPTSGSVYGSGGGGMNGANFDFSSGANGFQGVVIIRYAGAQKGAGGTVSCIGGGSPPNCVSFTLHTFTTSGTFTP